jgi:hypothetical protein
MMGGSLSSGSRPSAFLPAQKLRCDGCQLLDPGLGELVDQQVAGLLDVGRSALATTLAKPSSVRMASV